MSISAPRVKELIRRGEKSKIDLKAQLELKTNRQKEEFAKDVSANANTSAGTGYLLIGITNNKKIIGIKSNSFKEEQFQQIIAKRVDLPVVFSAYTTKVDGKYVGVIEIPTSLKKPHQMIHDRVFYMRRGTTTDKMSVQEVVNSVKRRLETERKVSSDYEQYPIPKRGKKILYDITSVFRDMGFRHKTKKVSYILGYGPLPVTLNIFESIKLKQRFCVEIYFGNLDSYNVGKAKNIIGSWWSNLSESQMLNAGLIITEGTISQQAIESKYYRPRNVTFKKIDSKNFYYGIGEIDSPTKKEIQEWYGLENAVPKFFLSKIRSKEDLSDRITVVQQFISENKLIFKLATKLKKYKKIQEKVRK